MTNTSAATEGKPAGSVPDGTRKIVYNKPDTTRQLQYHPPTRGAPSVRVSGSTRISNEWADVTLSVLAPNHVGLTTKTQPSLFWYQSRPAQANFELTLMEGDQIKPLLQVNMASSKQDGIQRLRLTDHKVNLALNVEYQWVVALVTDRENRSKDIVASGYIKRIATPDDLNDRLKKTIRAELPFVYAEAGIWYDALEAISDQIDAAPGNRVLRELRSDLLRQVELDKAATFDSKAIAGK